MSVGREPVDFISFILPVAPNDLYVTGRSTPRDQTSKQQSVSNQ